MKPNCAFQEVKFLFSFTALTLPLCMVFHFLSHIYLNCLKITLLYEKCLPKQYPSLAESLVYIVVYNVEKCGKSAEKERGLFLSGNP